jgi:hypothetical protein
MVHMDTISGSTYLVTPGNPASAPSLLLRIRKPPRCLSSSCPTPCTLQQTCAPVTSLPVSAGVPTSCAQNLPRDLHLRFGLMKNTASTPLRVRGQFTYPFCPHSEVTGYLPMYRSNQGEMGGACSTYRKRWAARVFRKTCGIS